MAVECRTFHKGHTELSKALCSFLRSLLGGNLNHQLHRDTSYNTKTKEDYLRQTVVSTGSADAEQRLKESAHWGSLERLGF